MFFFVVFFSVMTELTEQRTGAPTVPEFSHATGRPTARGGGARAHSWGGATCRRHPFGDRGTCAGARTDGVPDGAKNSPKNVENGRGAKSGA